MISNIQAILLGLIQGLTEFIPISSTAHLRIIPAFMDLPDPGAAYSAVIQLGTLISLLIYFRNDLIEFTLAAWKGLRSGEPFGNQDSRMVWYLILGTIPVSVFGLMFSKLIVGPARSLYVIGGSLIFLALILYVVDRRARLKKSVDELNWMDILWIGFAQSLALIPGASRSGTTLTMGLFLGYTREAAMRVSFLLSIPAIGLSGVYELIKEREELMHLGMEGLLTGTLVAAVAGYITIAGLLRYLRTHSTIAFVLYRIAMGLLVYTLVLSGRVSP